MQRLYVTLSVLTALLCGSAFTAHATEADDQRALVQKFISAYFIKDMATARTYLPKNRASLFTQYPFTAPPTLASPKVHENQALVEFTGAVADKQFIGKGGILLCKHGNLWQVRQVLFYNKIPPIFNLPAKSVTNADRAQEGTVAGIAKKFVAQWKAKNGKGMLGLWYNWVKDNPRQIKDLKMSNFQTSLGKTRWNEPYVNYSVKLDYKLLGKFPVSMNARGGMVLVKEGKAWKVRGNSYILMF